MIHTGHKTFDRLANKSGIYTGNVWGDVQFSSFIRGHNRTECNGFTFPSGHLQAADLKSYPGLPPDVIQCIEHHTKSESVVLHKFRSPSGKQTNGLTHWITHGYLVNRSNGRGKEQVIAKFVVNRTHKSRNIIDTMARQLSNR